MRTRGARIFSKGNLTCYNEVSCDGFWYAIPNALRIVSTIQSRRPATSYVVLLFERMLFECPKWSYAFRSLH